MPIGRLEIPSRNAAHVMKSRSAERFLQEYVKDAGLGLEASDVDPGRLIPEEMRDLREKAVMNVTPDLLVS